VISWIYKDRLVPALISEMELLDVYCKARWSESQIHVNADWADSGHVSDSQHYTGRAVDFVLQGVPFIEGWLALERFAFKGIGLYPYWNTPGYHADVRIAPYRARWIRDVHGNYANLRAETLHSLSAGV